MTLDGTQQMIRPELNQTKQLKLNCLCSVFSFIINSQQYILKKMPRLLPEASKVMVRGLNSLSDDKWGTITYWRANSIALRVDQASNLGEVAVSLCDVLYAGGLHEEGIVSGQDSCNPFLVVLHQGCVLPAAHECPHLLVR